MSKKTKTKAAMWLGFLFMFLGVMGTMMAFLNGGVLDVVFGVILAVIGVLFFRYSMNQ